MPFTSPASLQTRPVMMANPTPNSGISLVSAQNECVASTNFLITPTSAMRVLLRAYSGPLYLVSAEFPTNKSCPPVRCGLSDTALSISVSKGYHFFIFLCFGVCVSLIVNKDLVDRGLPAGGLKKAGAICTEYNIH